ncbi:uncharacterized protein N7482_010623 [Penicillium canariense]|uniref:Uncharacterized protein n=1 Tax=Penicillium canariense TaxID=189055 RepID=A0A9W9LD44_9EURO|nr:uncharacterized protein N7482_010623 [Penicillium canariense]KAJ5151371.1 hypothetical protein N7482_010623 [Penicillium canariense]
MSVTTTSTTTGSLSALADYEVHHSGSEPDASAAPVNIGQPTDWPTHHRRMPAYRPANPQLDRTDRPAGNGHPAEYAFIQIMLHGVWLNASVARLWRFTGGRINDKIFHYEVGGEW